MEGVSAIGEDTQHILTLVFWEADCASANTMKMNLQNKENNYLNGNCHKWSCEKTAIAKALPSIKLLTSDNINHIHKNFRFCILYKNYKKPMVPTTSKLYSNFQQEQSLTCPIIFIINLEATTQNKKKYIYDMNKLHWSPTRFACITTSLS